MNCYLDTSAFVAWFDPRNPHFRPVAAWREKQKTIVPSYNRLIQVETRHYLRRLTHSEAGLAWHAFRAVENLRLVEWTKLDFPRLLEQAEDLSQLHKPQLQCGFWDICHVVAALKAELPFVTCDARQAEAARQLGLKTSLIA